MIRCQFCKAYLTGQKSGEYVCCDAMNISQLKRRTERSSKEATEQYVRACEAETHLEEAQTEITDLQRRNDNQKGTINQQKESIESDSRASFSITMERNELRACNDRQYEQITIACSKVINLVTERDELRACNKRQEERLLDTFTRASKLKEQLVDLDAARATERAARFTNAEVVTKLSVEINEIEAVRNDLSTECQRLRGEATDATATLEEARQHMRYYAKLAEDRRTLAKKLADDVKKLEAARECDALACKSMDEKNGVLKNELYIERQALQNSHAHSERRRQEIEILKASEAELHLNEAADRRKRLLRAVEAEEKLNTSEHRLNNATNAVAATLKRALNAETEVFNMRALGRDKYHLIIEAEKEHTERVRTELNLSENSCIALRERAEKAESENTELETRVAELKACSKYSVRHEVVTLRNQVSDLQVKVGEAEAMNEELEHRTQVAEGCKDDALKAETRALKNNRYWKNATKIEFKKVKASNAAHNKTVDELANYIAKLDDAIITLEFYAKDGNHLPITARNKLRLLREPCEQTVKITSASYGAGFEIDFKTLELREAAHMLNFSDPQAWWLTESIGLPFCPYNPLPKDPPTPQLGIEPVRINNLQAFIDLFGTVHELYQATALWFCYGGQPIIMEVKKS